MGDMDDENGPYTFAQATAEDLRKYRQFGMQRQIDRLTLVGPPVPEPTTGAWGRIRYYEHYACSCGEFHAALVDMLNEKLISPDEFKVEWEAVKGRNPARADVARLRTLAERDTEAGAGHGDGR